MKAECVVSPTFEVSKNTNIRFEAFCLVGKKVAVLIFKAHSH